jgi:hypothetical protein
MIKNARQKARDRAYFASFDRSAGIIPNPENWYKSTTIRLIFVSLGVMSAFIIVLIATAIINLIHIIGF